MIDWEDQTARALREQNDSSEHREIDPWVWHPSQTGYCKRQAYTSKLDLEEHDAETLGRFKVGTLLHEWFEETFEDKFETATFEMPIQYEHGDVTIVGRTDVYYIGDNYDWIFDFKSRSGWYNFDPPKKRHMDQLFLYMAATDADFGQVVYVSKKDMEIRTYPEDTGVRPDSGRVQQIIDHVSEISEVIEEQGLPSSRDEIPFPKCGCWICDNESLVDDSEFY